MFGSVTIEVVIGLAFIYLLFSLVCSALTEAVARVLRLRSGTLQKAIDNMLVGQPTSSKQSAALQQFYRHPLIQSLTAASWYDRLLQRKPLCAFVGGGLIAASVITIGAPALPREWSLPQWLDGLTIPAVVALWYGILLLIAAFFRYTLDGPAYISSDIFAQVFTDLFQAPPAESSTPAAATLNDKPSAQIFEKFVQRAGEKASLATDADPTQLLQQQIEQWYDNVMDRVSGWYKRKARTIVLCFAILVTLLFNVDTLAIASALIHDQDLSKKVADTAVVFMQQNPTPDASENSAGTTPGIDATSIVSDTAASIDRINMLKTEIGGLGVPIGWVIETAQISNTLPIAPILDYVVTRVDFSKPNPVLTKEQAMQTQRLLPVTAADWGKKSAGLALTIILLSLGAPFWFDLLGKLVNLRSSGTVVTDTQAEVGKASN